MVSIEDLEKQQKAIVANSNVIVELAFDSIGFDREKNKHENAHLYPPINVLCTKVGQLEKDLLLKKEFVKKYSSVLVILNTNIEEYYKLQEHIDYFKTLVVFDTKAYKERN